MTTLNDQTPADISEAVGSVLSSVIRAAALLWSGRIHLQKGHLQEQILFADGTSAPIFRETTVDRRPEVPCVLVVRFRLRWVRGRGHWIFRRESVLNTPLFVGFPGFISKLWLANDERGRYRGLYEWDGPDLAEHYACCLWRVLQVVSVPGSISYQVVPGVTREEILARSSGWSDRDLAEQGQWWYPMAGHATPTPVNAGPE